MWMSLVVMLEKIHFGSEVHVFCPPSLKHNFSIHVSLPAEETGTTHTPTSSYCTSALKLVFIYGGTLSYELYIIVLLFNYRQHAVLQALDSLQQ